MILPYFASFIVFIILIAYEIRKNSRIAKAQEDAFWDRENKANSTRKKSLDDLNYISIQIEMLPFTIMEEDPSIMEIHTLIKSLSETKIVNLTGFSNTDLKLKYGAANLSLLSQFDKNYTLLVRTLQKWASLLYQNGYIKEAQDILEFAVSTKTDISGTYKLLATIYVETGYPSRISELKEVASTLQSVMQKPIVRMLKESDPHIDLPHS